MLIIRDAQLDAFEAVAREAFERTMVADLQWTPASDRHASLAGVDVSDVVRQAVARGMDLGLTVREDFRRLARVVYRYGLALDRDPERPWIGRVLRNQTMTPAERIQLLEDWNE